MEKSNAMVKVDLAQNWAKATKYIPDIFTVIVYTFEDGAPPKIKMGDGIHVVNELPFLVSKEVKDSVLIL